MKSPCCGAEVEHYVDNLHGCSRCGVLLKLEAVGYTEWEEEYIKKMRAGEMDHDAWGCPLEPTKLSDFFLQKEAK